MPPRMHSRKRQIERLPTPERVALARASLRVRFVDVTLRNTVPFPSLAGAHLPVVATGHTVLCMLCQEEGVKRCIKMMDDLEVT